MMIRIRNFKIRKKIGNLNSPTKNGDKRKWVYFILKTCKTKKKGKQSKAAVKIGNIFK